MAWYLFYRNDNGDLVSQASELPVGLDTQLYGTVDVGTRPDWVVKSWNPTLRVLFDTPLPILIDRLDDIQARFLADADFVAVWTSLNAARRTQIRTGLNRVLSFILGGRRFRQEDDPAEIN